MWFPHDKPRHCVLFRREAPRAHNLHIKRPFQKVQFNIRFGTIWQHDFGSPREPPFKRSRIINFLCPDIARHIDVQQLSIHIEGYMFKINASIPPGRQPPGKLAPRPNALMFYHGNGQHVARALRVTSTRNTTSAYVSPALRSIPARSIPCTKYGNKMAFTKRPI